MFVWHFLPYAADGPLFGLMLVCSKAIRFVNKRKSRWSDFCPVATFIRQDCGLMPGELSWGRYSGVWACQAASALSPKGAITSVSQVVQDFNFLWLRVSVLSVVLFSLLIYSILVNCEAKKFWVFIIWSPKWRLSNGWGPTLLEMAKKKGHYGQSKEITLFTRHTQ